MAKSKAYQKYGGAKIADDSITGIRKRILTEPANSVDDIAKFSKDMAIDKAIFTANGNSISSQTATLSAGNKRLDLSFTTDYDPRRITNPTKKTYYTNHGYFMGRRECAGVSCANKSRYQKFEKLKKAI